MSVQPEPQAVGMFDVWEQDDDAEPARRDYLQTAIDRVNGKPAITRMVGPGSEQFAAALQEHLVKYFGLRLG